LAPVELFGTVRMSSRQVFDDPSVYAWKQSSVLAQWLQQSVASKAKAVLLGGRIEHSSNSPSARPGESQMVKLDSA
jgi:hypothetical protein